jgi:hypothetical protein
LICSLRSRHRGRLDAPPEPVPPDPSAPEILASSRAWRRAWGWLLSGGEPTLRPDLTDLVASLAADGAPRLGLATDGVALDREVPIARLAGAGLKRVRIPFHCARPDAHDWLVGRRGAARHAYRAVRACVAAGLAVEAEVIVTRPTAPYLEETVEVLARAGARRILLRAPSWRRLSEADVIAVAPRLALVEPYLESAVGAAQRGRVAVSVLGFPACAAGRVAWAIASAAAERRVWPFATRSCDEADPGPEPGVPAACAGCPGPPGCVGIPRDYVTRFGWAELDSERAAEPTGRDAERPHGSPRASAVPAPPPRAGRAPATRVRFAVQQAARGRLGGDPLAGMTPAAPASSIRMVFAGPSRVACPQCGDPAGGGPEPSRAIRNRLVRAAQEGAPVLRVASAGTLAHPQAADLLREATRLSFAGVEAAGEGSALDEWPDGALARLAPLARLDVAVYGPDAPSHDAHAGRPGALEAALRGCERLHNLTKVPVGAYAVLHDATPVADYAESWACGALPGKPAFRLSPRGGSLEALAAAGRSLPRGPARAALAQVLPPCLLDGARSEEPATEWAWGNGRGEAVAPSGSDRRGTYEPCPKSAGCAEAPRCPGLATGWAVDVAVLRPVAGARA